MENHERRMQRPVSELFPPTGPRVTSVCRHCKAVYTRSATAGKARGFCSDLCRDNYREKRTGRDRASRNPRVPRLLQGAS